MYPSFQYYRELEQAEAVSDSVQVAASLDFMTRPQVITDIQDHILALSFLAARDNLTATWHLSCISPGITLIQAQRDQNWL